MLVVAVVTTGPQAPRPGSSAGSVTMGSFMQSFKAFLKKVGNLLPPFVKTLLIVVLALLGVLLLLRICLEAATWAA